MSESYKNLFYEADQSLGLRKEQLLHQLAEYPTDEAMPILLHILRDDPDKCTGDTAIQIIDRMGYPRNELALPALVICLSGNINDPRYRSAVNTLLHIGPDVVVPYMLRILLGKGQSYFDETDYDSQVWANTIEGICYTIILEEVEKEYALLCCPAINYLLSLNDSVPNLNYNVLLKVIEKVAVEVDYVIPTLIKFIQQHKESKSGVQAKQLLLAFSQEARAPYKFLIDNFSV